MLNYEWKKICHSPIALFAAVLIILFKLSALAIQCSSTELTAADRLMDTLYSDSTLLEINQRINIDLADADAALEINIAEAYANGEISIEEYRAWLEDTENRYIAANAFSAIKNRVSELMALQDTYENALRDKSLNAVNRQRYIARWKPLRLLHDHAWNAMYALEKIAIGGYWVLLMVVPLLSELWDTRMDILVRSCGNGWEKSNRAKMSLIVILVLSFWLIDCFIDYGLPGIIWGYGAMDTAIQSVQAYSTMILPWSLKEYLVSCCLLRLCGYFALYSAAAVICLIIRSTYRAFVICAGVYMLIDVLNLCNWSIDKLITPGVFFEINIEPVRIMFIIGGYCTAILLFQASVRKMENSVGVRTRGFSFSSHS